MNLLLFLFLLLFLLLLFLISLLDFLPSSIHLLTCRDITVFRLEAEVVNGVSGLETLDFHSTSLLLNVRNIGSMEGNGGCNYGVIKCSFT